MTLKEVTSAVQEALRVSNDYDPYAEGYQDALFWFSDLLDKLDYPYPWHSYPREKPPKDGYYLASWGFEVPIGVKFEGRHFNLSKVKAWAELPKLYKGEKDERQSAKT